MICETTVLVVISCGKVCNTIGNGISDVRCIFIHVLGNKSTKYIIG